MRFPVSSWQNALARLGLKIVRGLGVDRRKTTLPDRRRRHATFSIESLEDRRLLAADFTAGIHVGEDAEPTVVALSSYLPVETHLPIQYELVSNSNPSLVGTSQSAAGGIADGILRLAYAHNASGEATIEVRATDGNETWEGTLTVTVVPINDYPVVESAPGVLRFSEGDASAAIENVSQYFSDVESTELTYTLSRIDVPDDGRIWGGAYNAETDELPIILGDDFGDAQFALRATDEGGLKVATTVWVIVDPVNDAPTVTDPLPDRAFENNNDEVVIDLWEHFRDLEDLTYLDFSVGPPSDATAFAVAPTVDAHGFLKYTPSNQPGLETTSTVVVTATDRDQASVTDEFQVEVSNDPPDNLGSTSGGNQNADNPDHEFNVLEGAEFSEIVGTIQLKPLGPDEERLVSLVSFGTEALMGSDAYLLEEGANENQIVIIARAGLDYEVQQSHSFTIYVRTTKQPLQPATDDPLPEDPDLPPHGDDDPVTEPPPEEDYSGDGYDYPEEYEDENSSSPGDDSEPPDLELPEVSVEEIHVRINVLDRDPTLSVSIDLGSELVPLNSGFSEGNIDTAVVPVTSGQTATVLKRVANNQKDRGIQHVPGSWAEASQGVIVPARITIDVEPHNLGKENGIPAVLHVSATDDIIPWRKSYTRWIEAAVAPTSVGVSPHTGAYVDLAVEGIALGDATISVEVSSRDGTPIGSASADMAVIQTSAKDDIDLVIDQMDADGDGIIDYLDGFNADKHDPEAEDLPADDQSSAVFEQLTVQLPSGVAAEDALVRFDYGHAEQASLTDSSLLSPSRVKIHDVGGHQALSLWSSLRLWTKDGTHARKPHSVDDAEDPGDYVGARHVYRWSDLAGTDTTLTLFAEVLRAGEYKIEVQIDPDGDESRNNVELYGSPNWYFTSPEQFGHGFALRDSITITAQGTVGVFATDKFGGENSDAVAFNFSSGTMGAGTGYGPIYYRLKFDDSTATDGLDGSAFAIEHHTPRGFASDALIAPSRADYLVEGGYLLAEGPGGVGLMQDPYTLVGAAHDGATIIIRPLDDVTIEWDEKIRLELITYEEYRDLFDTPRQENHWATPGTGSLIYGLTDSEFSERYIPIRKYSKALESFYVIDPAHASAEVTLFDNDAIVEHSTRNADVDSTGQARESIANGVVAVDLYRGEVTLTMPVGIGPIYRGDDNLLPIVAVEMQLPFEEDLGAPTELKGTMTFAGISGEEVTFDTSRLAEALAENPHRELRLVVAGPQDLAEQLRTGNYDFDVEFTAAFGDGDQDEQTVHRRTARGNAEIINRVDDTYGTDEFGDRWWMDELHRLVPGDGISAATDPTRGWATAASRLAPQGAASESGMALIRGDNSSAWFTSFGGGGQTLTAFEAESISGRDHWQAIGGGRDLFAQAPLYSTGGTKGEAHTIAWTFDDLPPNQQYQVLVNWSPGADRAPNVPITVKSARAVGSADTEKTTLVDQRYGGQRSLGFYVPEDDGGLPQITVEISTQLPGGGFADGLVTATSVMLISDRRYVTPDGSFVHLSHVNHQPNSAESWDRGGYWAEEGFTPEAGSFVLLTKHGDRYEFSDDGLLQGTEDRNGNRTEYLYANEIGETDALASSNGDLFHELRRITHQGGLETTFEYTGGLLEKITDFANRETEYAITDGKLKRITLPSAATGQSSSHLPEYEFEYDDRGKLEKVIDAEDNETAITMSGETHVVNADGGEWYVAPYLGDRIGKILQAGNGAIGANQPDAETALVQARAIYRDPRYNTWTYQTDPHGFLTAEAKPATADASREDVWRWLRNKHGLVTKHIQPAGGGGYGEHLPELVTEYHFGAKGALGWIVYPKQSPALQNGFANITESWSYDDFGLVVMHTNPLGIVTNYQRDSRGNLELMTEGHGGELQRKTAFAHTAAPQSIDDLPGGLVEEVRVGLGTIDEVATRTEYYEADSHTGLVKKVTSALGSSVESAVEYEYDAHGNLDKFYDALGRVTDYDYDALDRLTQVTQPDPDVSAGGSPIALSDNSTLDQHDAPVTRYEYDAMGNQTRVFDARSSAAGGGYFTQYVYDPMHRLKAIILPPPGGASATSQLKSITEYRYDPNGNLHQEINHLDGVIESGQPADVDRVTTYVFDPRNLLTRIKQGDPGYTDVPQAPSQAISAVQEAPIVNFTYDKLGNVATQSDARTLDGTKHVTKYIYDELGQVIKEIQPGDETAVPFHTGVYAPVTIYQYDAAGQAVKVISSANSGVASNSLLPSADFEAGANSNLAVTEYEYDALGRLAQVHSPIDANGGDSTTTYTYDLRNNLKHTILNSDDGHIVATNHYDKQDRLIAIDHPEPSAGQTGLLTLYAHNAAGEVVAELTREGSWTEPVESFSPGYLALEYAALSGLGAKVRYSTYVSDGLGRVVEATSPDPDGDGGLSAPRTIYKYDANGNVVRTQQSLQHSPEALEQTLVSETKYDTLDRAWHVVGPLVYDGSLFGKADKSDVREHVVHFNADGSIRQTFNKNVIDGNTQWQSIAYTYDNLGRQNTASQGGVTSATFFDAAGNLVIETSPASDFPTWHEYDELNRLVTTHSTLAQGVNLTTNDSVTNHDLTTEYRYFTDGNLWKQWSSQSGYDGRVEYKYDRLGRILQLTQHVDLFGDSTTSFVAATNSYDGFGNLESVVTKTSAGSYAARTDFTYNNLGQLETESNLYGTRTKSYDAFGNLMQEVDRQHRTIQYAHNNLGQVLRETWYDTESLAREDIPASITSASEISSSYSATFDYSSLGQVVSASNFNASYDFNYNNLRQQTAVNQDITGLGNYTLAYQQDLLGNVTRQAITSSEGELVANTYKYDALNRVHTTVQTGSEVKDKSVELKYNGPHLAYIKRYESASPSTAPIVAQTRFTYYDDGLAYGLVHSRDQNDNDFALDQYMLYDSRGRLYFASIEGLGGKDFTSSFSDSSSYDPTAQDSVLPYGRLEDTMDRRVTYDAEGNLTSRATYETQFAFDSNDGDGWYEQEDKTLTKGWYRMAVDTASLSVNSPDVPLRLDLVDGTQPLGIGAWRPGLNNGPVASITLDLSPGAASVQSVSFKLLQPITYNDLRITVNGSDYPSVLDYTLTEGDEAKIHIGRRDRYETLEYDHRNRVTKVVSHSAVPNYGDEESNPEKEVTYHYDPLGQVIGKSVEDLVGDAPISHERYVNAGGQRVLKFNDDGELKQVYFYAQPGGALAAVENALDGAEHERSAVIWTLADVQNAIRDIFVSDYSHGHQHLALLTSGIAAGTTGGFAAALDSTFANYYYDGETGLWQTAGRFFDGASGHFVSEQPGGLLMAQADLYAARADAPTGELKLKRFGYNVHAKDQGFMHHWMNHQDMIRVMGTLQYIGGVVQVVGGTLAGPLGVPLIVRGIDDIQAGVRTVIKGEHVHTFTYDSVKNLTGSEKAAFWADLATGMASPGMVAGVGVKSLSAASRAARLGRAGSLANKLDEMALAAKFGREADELLPVLSKWGDETGFCWLAGTELVLPAKVIAGVSEARHGEFDAAAWDPVMLAGAAAAAAGATGLAIRARRRRDEDSAADVLSDELARDDRDNDWFEDETLVAIAESFVEQNLSDLQQWSNQKADDNSSAMATNAISFTKQR